MIFVLEFVTLQRHIGRINVDYLSWCPFSLQWLFHISSRDGLMPHTKNSRFDLAGYMKVRKEAREKAVSDCCNLKSQLDRDRKRIKRLKSKV